MTTKTAEKISMPSFRYRGFDVPALDLSTSLIDDLKTSEPAYKLAPKSAPLSWKVGLYMVGRDLEIGSEEAEALPGPVKEAGRMVYSDCQERKAEGTWHKDGVLFLPKSEKPKGMWPMPDGYALAKYSMGIAGFTEKDGVWQPDPEHDTIEEYMWLPPGDGRFVAPPDSGEGAYHPLGPPRFTVGDRKEAVKRWVNAGLTEQQAGKELSIFYRADSGTRAVISWSDGDDGPLCVNLYGEPRGRGSSIGSFAASRSAERSEAPKNSGYRLLTSDEFRSFENDRKALETIRKAVNK